MTPCRLAVLAVSFFAATLATPAFADDMAVVSTVPARNTMAAATTVIEIEFDRAVQLSSVDSSSLRVFGRGTGTATGSFTFLNSNKTVRFTPDEPFSAGEIVYVNLSNDLTAADTSPLRSAGYAFQFTVASTGGSMTFTFLNAMTNRDNSGSGPHTQIYGAQATDLNNDEYLDLATVNEVTGDVRVFMNLADGTGLYQIPFLSPEDIGLEASPNEMADFDNDGNTDGVFSAAIGDGEWIMLGNGDGTYGSPQVVNLGGDPHGVAVLDVDGDADFDIVAANVAFSNLALMINNGSGVFGAPSTFDGGVGGEYGLASADMDSDGIMDLVVAGRDGQDIRTLKGNGNGTFTQLAAEDTEGNTWVVALGDIDGDLDIDATVANAGNASVGGASLKNNGDGTFANAVIQPTTGHTPSTDLGDLDADGDLDWILSIYGAGEWLMYANDGSGNFTFVDDFPATANPSCAVMLDFDNDGDIDLALTDEIDDVVGLWENNGVSLPTATPACAETPVPCRTPSVSGKALIQLKDKSPNDKDGLLFKWIKGSVTTKAEFNDPDSTETYDLCIYDDDQLISGGTAPAGGFCAGKACWQEKTTGYNYKDVDLTPHGIQKIVMREGLLAGKSKIVVKGKGANIDMPNLNDVTGPLDVQLQQRNGGLCFGAHYSSPFLKDDGVTLKDKAD